MLAKAVLSNKISGDFLLDFTEMRSVDGFTRQSLVACSEHQIVTLDTLHEHITCQI